MNTTKKLVDLRKKVEKLWRNEYEDLGESENESVERQLHRIHVAFKDLVGEINMSIDVVKAWNEGR